MSQDGNPEQGLLGEVQLRQIARDIKQHVPHSSSDDDINKLQHLLDSVLFASASTTIDPGHRVAAWNTLCAIIDATLESPNEGLKQSLWPTGLWNRCFALYIHHSHNARPKSSKQLIGSLTRVLTRPDQSKYATDLTSNLCRQLADILCATEVQKSTKAGLILLTHLFAKDVFSLDSIPLHSVPTESTVVFGANSATAIERLLLAALQWVSRADLASVVGQLATVTLDKAVHYTPSLVEINKPPKRDDRMPPWARPLQAVLLNDQENVDAYRSHIFPALFKRSVPQYIVFLTNLGLSVQGYSQPLTRDANGSASTNKLLYAALQVGKSLGIVEDTTSEIVTFENKHLLLPVTYTSSLVSSASRSARVAGLSLLVTSVSATKPYEPSVLEQLKRNLSHLHADTDSNFRSELFSLVQRMLDRLRASTAAAARSAADNAKSTDAKAVVSRHKSFLQWYLGYLSWELRSTASYQRHVSALKSLLLVIRCGVDSSISNTKLSKSASGSVHWPFDITIVDDGLQRLLLDLLMDPFDDVRQTASAILDLHYSGDDQRPLDTSMLHVALERAIRAMLSSGRADHADGVAHMYALSYVVAKSPEEQESVISELLVKTAAMLQAADADLGKAVDQFPLHGLLTSIRYVFMRYSTKHGTKELLSSIHRMLEQVWTVVRPTLCNDAPEGHLPDDIDETADISSKDILSYCWRALKEASLLMGVMLSPAVLTAAKSSVEPSNDLETNFKLPMIDLCFRQLAELRHRGAFSTVAQTWVACCSLMIEDDSSPLSLAAWYQRTLKLLGESITINTRRSAGLPSLLCGILVAARSSQLFERAFADLEAIARDPVDSSLAQGDSLTQVHAMNCMKDILKNTKLAEQSERYVPVALRLAADSLRSDAWAIRNCGLMLFRAVIDRLLGTNDSYVDDGLASSRRVDFEQHPELLELVTGLLNSGHANLTAAENARNEGVFPALQLLQRAVVPANKQSDVQNAVFALTKSSSWHVRDKAARTYVSYVPVAETGAVLGQILAGNHVGQNAEHGALLVAKYLLWRLLTRVKTRTVSSESRQLTSDEQPCGYGIELASLLDGRAVCPYNVDAFGDLQDVADQLRSWRKDAELETNLDTVSTKDVGVLQAIDDSIDELSQVYLSELGSKAQDITMRTVHNAADANAWLEARVLYLDRRAKALDDASSSAWYDWAHATETALNNDSIFSRNAAARSLASVANLWQHLESNGAQPLFRVLCLTIYDLLNDDDEDVRILAASTSCKILIAHGSSDVEAGLVPLVASQRLVQLVISRWPSAEDIARAALKRAFSITSSPHTPASQQLDALSHDNYALFAEEKQNLYIDEAREIRIWSHVASHLTPSSIPKTLLHNLAHWTADALSTFITAAESQPNDSSSKPEIFTLGLQVVHAVDVLLALVEQGVRLPVKPSELKTGLVDMLGAWRKSGNSVLWIREAEKVLEGVAVRSVKASLGVMGRMGEGLESEVHLGLL